MCSLVRRFSMWLVLALALGSWLWPRSAEARFYNPGDKAGPLMFNMKLGAAIGIPGDGGSLFYTADQFLLQLEFGGALDAGRQAYLTFPLTFELGGSYNYYNLRGPSGYNVVMVPLAFQYDIPIRAVPGLYLYPRGQIGYAAFIGRNGAGTSHFGFIAPEFGIKYVLKRRWNFGGEPFSLPVFFNRDGALMNYRLTFYAGVNF